MTDQQQNRTTADASTTAVNRIRTTEASSSFVAEIKTRVSRAGVTTRNNRTAAGAKTTLSRPKSTTTTGAANV